MSRKLLLFDIDGTLVVTAGAGMRAMDRAFTEVFGFDQALEGLSLAGRTDRAIVDDVLSRKRRNGGLTSDEYRRFCQSYFDFLREEMIPDARNKRVLPGIRPLLDVLSARGDIALALLTGNLEEGARIKLEHFDLWDYFDFGAFGQDVVDRAALLPVALDRAHAHGHAPFAAGEVVVIGDTPHDVSCARAGGARAVAVATGPYSRADLELSGADIVLDDLTDSARFLSFIES